MSEQEEPKTVIIDTDHLDQDQREALTRLGGLTAEEELSDLSELFELEEREAAGFWIPWTWSRIQGAELLLARAAEARHAFSKSEREYRTRKGLRTTDPLPPGVLEHLYRDALFGRSVKDWRGIKLDGVELEFNEANYRKLWKLLRFRDFVVQKTGAIEFASTTGEEEAGEF